MTTGRVFAGAWRGRGLAQTVRVGADTPGTLYGDLRTIFELQRCKIKSGPKRCGKHRPGLTHRLDLGERGLAVQATRCSIDGCEKSGKITRGMCKMHYTRWQRNGDPGEAGPRNYRADACSIIDCSRSGPYVKGLCPKHYASHWRYGDPLHASTIRPRNQRCDAPGCDLPSKTDGLCPKHYWRHKTHGSYELPPPNDRYVRADGYVLIRVLDHPLARLGWAFEHRVVLYGAIGAGVHACYWCGCDVSWGDGLTTDHLDWDRGNNDPSNLVASCLSCNSGRLQRHG